MGWIHAKEDGQEEQGSWDMRAMTKSPFKPYVHPEIIVSLVIGEFRFERKISEKRKILNQIVNGVRHDHVIDLKISAYDVPEYLLEGISREDLVKEWRWHGDPKEGMNVTFIPQEDGSYKCDEWFPRRIAGFVKECKKM